MKICSWNVNSINMRKTLVLDWLKTNSPDVALLQETKTLNENFPREEIEDLGYNIALSGQKTFNGVAILSKYPLDEIITEFPNMPNPEQTRYIEALVQKDGRVVRVASVYVPNGQSLDSEKYPYKIEFLKALRQHMEELLKLDEIQVFGGDFNIAHQELDTYSVLETRDTVLFHQDMRLLLNSIMNIGWHDLFRCKHPSSHEYSWWDYRGGAWQKNKGLRIDYLFGSPEAVDLLESAEINHDERGKDKPSDHVPVICELKL